MAQEFNAIAQDYDSTFSHTPVGRLLRARVYACTKHFLGQKHPKNSSTLELNCGTGEDAIWLARQGFQVLATDASPEMIRIVHAKIKHDGLEQKLKTQECTFKQLAEMPESGFDLIFSNFGGLNCVAPEEMEQLGAVIAQKLQPGGKFIAVVMGRFCCWESLYFLLKLNPGAAFRRFNLKPVDARLDANTTVRTWYYTPAAFKKHLQMDGQKSTIKPIGFWLPPSYLNPFFEKRPRLLRLLNFLEKNFTPSWLALAADHFLICIESKKP